MNACLFFLVTANETTSFLMADFDEDLNSYIQARTVRDDKERLTSLIASFPHPHPDGFQSTQDAPAFAQHSVSQMWHDASTGTFSYYDPVSSTYIPVEGPDSPHPILVQQQQEQLQQQQLQQQQQQSLYTDLATGYQFDRSDQRQTSVEEPPDSDATLRLCVLSSEILPIGGVILMDASGLSFGRDRPLSGQGKRVRMVEMGVSRFHASIYLDRQYYTPEQQQPQQGHSPLSSQPDDHLVVEDPSIVQSITEDASWTPSSAASTPISSSVGTFGVATVNLNGSHSKTEEIELQSSESTPKPVPEEEEGTTSESLVKRHNVEESSSVADEGDNDHEDGEIEDSPSAGAQGSDQRDQEHTNHLEESYENEQRRKAKEKAEREYQEELDRQYHHYYQSLASQQPPVLVDTFQIVDSGSTHGTLLNGERLSAAKTASQPHPLKHLDQLQLGTTVIEIHAHEEGRICTRCQITDTNEIEVLDDKESGRPEAKAAIAAASLASKNAAALGLNQTMTREQERIEEMNRLRKKWAGPEKKSAAVGGVKRSGKGISSGSHSPNGQVTVEGSTTYVDRAAKRRLYNPDHSSPLPSAQYPTFEDVPETTTGFHLPVAKTNKGHAMLSKMGWKAGTGLGASGQGVVEPVQLVVADKKAGLGSGSLQTQGAAAASASSPSSSRVTETPAEVARRKARERYSKLK